MDINKLERQKADIELMNRIKQKKFIKGFLQLVVKDENDKLETVVFELSKPLAKKTLMEDIKEDTIRLEKLEKKIKNEQEKIDKQNEKEHEKLQIKNAKDNINNI